MTKTSVSCTCPFCRKETIVSVPANGYQLWLRGALIQDALPDVPTQERETLLSGMCPECQERFYAAFADEDDEEEEEEEEE